MTYELIVFVIMLYVCDSYMFKNGLLQKQRIPILKSQTVSSNADTKTNLKVLLLVEPTPFNYVSGYANRFKETMKHLKSYGDFVQVVTPDPDPLHPKNYLGFPITTLKGFQCPYYNHVTLSIDTRFRTGDILKTFKPDILHVSTPSVLIFPAIYWARKFNIPLVMSYHTNVGEYAKSYFPLIPPKMIEAVNNCYMKFTHKFADLILCTSPQLKEQMQTAGMRRVDVWQKGINTEIYSQHFKDDDMRTRLSEGDVKAPLLLYVGRLGAEKKLDKLKAVLDRNPGVRLALVGTGPAEQALKEHFKGYPVNFVGQLMGKELSQAFASADVFVMPSDTETLGFVVLESLASGVPVVGVAAGGVVDIIRHGETGYLTSNTDDMVEFSDCVKRLVRDVSLRRTLGSAGVEWAKGWSWTAATDKLRNVQYKKAVALHGCRDANGRHVRELEEQIMSGQNI